jgi:uncharacterized protein (TIGR00730 family)
VAVPELSAICVYAGSSPGARPAYAEAARALGEAIAGRGLGLVYGGGDVGLMKVVADTAMEAGGHVTGIIPRTLLEREIGHGALTELLVVESMHERKLAMAERADAFIALPGGIGTVEELVEVLTWTQLGVHDKPCSVLDVEGYWQPLIALLDHAVTERFLPAQHREMLLSGTDPEALIDALEAWQPRSVPKWLDRERT